MNILFDLDGTLSETAPTVIESVDKVIKEFELLSVGRYTIVENIGKTTPDFLRVLFSECAKTPGLLTRFSQLAHGKVWLGREEDLSEARYSVESPSDIPAYVKSIMSGCTGR